MAAAAAWMISSRWERTSRLHRVTDRCGGASISTEEDVEEHHHRKPDHHPEGGKPLVTVSVALGNDLIGDDKDIAPAANASPQGRIVLAIRTSETPRRPPIGSTSLVNVA